MSPRLKVIGLLLAFVFIQFSDTSASPLQEQFIVDQSATPSTLDWWQNIAQIPQIGQEFTPTLTSVNFVELFMKDAECATTPPPHGDAALQVKVNIHGATINGPVIGASIVASLAPCFDDIARFQFPSVVPLVPGSVYVLEPVYVGGREAMVGAAVSDTYSGGAAISLGQRYTNSDLWFREGILVSIATTREDCKNGGWQQLTRADGTMFKNQGDCIKFVNKSQ